MAAALLLAALHPPLRRGAACSLSRADPRARVSPAPSCVAQHAASPLAALLSAAESPPSQRLVFVGGKGGVGKTSTSSALAVRCADEGFATLVVSTDPAHSLSDALMQDVSGGRPVAVDGCANLFAMEVETEEAIGRFRAAVGGFRASDLGLGPVAEELIGKLGLDEFADVLDTTPPGLDELLALAEVLALVRGEGSAAELARPGAAALAAEGFTRVIFDTAPTGHTLRLLAFPEFLDNLLTKVLALRRQLGGAIALLKGVLGGVDVSAKLDAAADRLAEWRDRVAELQRLLTEPEVTDFVIVGIPSRLAVAECARLLSALVEQGVAVNHLVVNQIITSGSTTAYIDRLKAEQRRAMRAVDGGTSALSSLQMSRVPYFNMEMRGVFPLKFLAAKAYGGEHAALWDDLLAGGGDRFVLMGGKGGVGKTTSSAALALACAEAGHATLVVSTDPAHSLGDAFDVDLSSGEVKRVEGVDGASLYACEVKVDAAVAEFKRVVRGLAEGSASRAEGEVGVADFADVFDAVPPGVDELVALSKVVSLARADEYGVHFTRVIIDTAPTGHTLRLLSFPEFLDRFIDRLLELRLRVQALSSVAGGVSALLGKLSSRPPPPPTAAAAPPAVAALQRYQAQMRELQALLHDPAASEFCIVTIPTALAIAESERLLEALRAQSIACRRGVLNRLLLDDADEAYVETLAKGQRVCLGELDALAARADVSITKVAYFDAEVRAVYGLRALADALFGAAPTPL
ncbi:hypothetical protein AB1Y20_023638 [Prymnesium parvum]|uniref:ArsA/GET3 Anion-transporting ATPase-like domain-containing protein n=1 Tax=Prymnesium parvum TaxID=97485 RepID=A0AB34JGU9_PRYPA